MTIHVEVTSRNQINRLRALLWEWPGSAVLILHVEDRTLRVSRALFDSPVTRAALKLIFGDDGVAFEITPPLEKTHDVRS